MTFPQHAKSMIGALTQARWCSYTSKLQSLQSIDEDNERWVLFNQCLDKVSKWRATPIVL